MKLDTFISDNLVERKDWNSLKLVLPSDLVERVSGNPINPKARAAIFQIGSSDVYTLLTTGGHPSSNRWHKDLTLDQAKTKATSWAARRYKLENKGE